MGAFGAILDKKNLINSATELFKLTIFLIKT